MTIDLSIFFFMVLSACIFGFRTSIRPVITIDHTFLKVKYLGTLFVVACKNDNNHINPLCFRIGDSENDASWEWFLRKLHEAIGHVDDLVVISYHHSSIEKVVQKVFPHESHGMCTYHLKQNLKMRFKSVEVHKLFDDDACTYRLVEFNIIYGQLQMISPRVATYLMDASVDRWARSHFSINKYNIITMGIVESFNATLKDVRDLILWLVEELRNLLQK